MHDFPCMFCGERLDYGQTCQACHRHNEIMDEIRNLKEDIKKIKDYFNQKVISDN